MSYEQKAVLGHEQFPKKQLDLKKMKILTPCFDPLERREIVDLVWVATRVGLQL